ncbi:Rho-binding antiterminator [Glaciecola siphonariae]|uniref:Rho-binding antiterminator n=1 Tax=Glaciecola siphonariae TaxID=521012 RepID=A0ABV9LV37_9ALTE
MISCQTFDYVEIACMYQLPINLIGKDSSEIRGKALTTLINDRRQECIELSQTNGLKACVVLDDIQMMLAEKTNPHFAWVNLVTNQMGKY